MKIFGIGLNKTGTTTLGRCLEMLGFKKHVSVRFDLLAKYREGSLDEIFSVADQNESFEDFPWPLMYRELYLRYGDGARYILTKRASSQDWLNSLKRHSLKTSRNNHCRLLAYGYAYPHGLEYYHLSFYQRHNQAIKDFFVKQRSEHLLLEISFDSGDGWDKLCGFLGLSVPNAQFPHENKGNVAVSADVEQQNIEAINWQLALLGKEPIIQGCYQG